MMMSALDIFSRQAAGRPSRVAGMVGDLGQRVQRYRTYRRTLEELEALTDRELADLGIVRSMCRSIAYRAAYDG